MERILISSGGPWEDIVGYSRAVRVSNTLEISGTTATDGNEIIGKGDMYVQAAFIFKKIENVLVEAGSKMEDVVRTRMFVTDISRWQEVAKAHSEAFANIRPAATMVEVARLIDEDFLIEIEITAIIV